MTFEEKEFLLKLGERITSLRKEKGISQLDLCSLINMEQPNLSAIENGRQNPTSLMLLKISKALDIKIEDFFIF